MPLQLSLEPGPNSERANAQAVIQAAADQLGIDLDLSPVSLKQIDTIIESFRQQGETLADVETALAGLACYVGEVFVNHAGGKWTSVAGGDGQPVMAILLPGGMTCFPSNKVPKRFEDGPQDSVADFYQSMAAKELERGTAGND